MDDYLFDAHSRLMQPGAIVDTISNYASHLEICFASLVRRCEGGKEVNLPEVLYDVLVRSQPSL